MRLLILMTFLITFCLADDLSAIDANNSWQLKRTNFYFDNDGFIGTDKQYTSGFKLSNLYYIPALEPAWLRIPFIYNEKGEHFISIGISQQIYTPDTITSSALIQSDRPYAGWLYAEFSSHQTSLTDLDSLSLQVGIIGKASQAEMTQTKVHKFFDGIRPKGWDNQLNNELGINLIYEHKWRLVPEPLFGIQSDFIPFVLTSLGNVKTEVISGTNLRFGWNILKDFGHSSIDSGTENRIPSIANYYDIEPWSLSFLVGAAAKAVARDIFLDGNTFGNSHSVEKENFVGYVSVGANLRYRRFTVEYISRRYTRQFKTESGTHALGSIFISYIY